MDKYKIKEIAKFIVAQKTTEKDVLKYIFDKFNKEGLRILLKYLKEEIKEQRVYIRTSLDDSEFKKDLQKTFRGKEIILEKDESLGGGIVVKYKDDILDLSIKGYVDKITNTLKENL